MNQRFICSPYRADGGFGASGAVLLLGTCCAAAIALGIVANFIGQWFYLVFIFPILIGGVLALAGGWAARKGNVRSPLLAGTAGLLGGVLAMLAMHYFNYLRFRSELAEVDPAVIQIAKTLPEWKAELPNLPPEVQELVNELDRNPAQAAFLRVDDFGGYMEAEAMSGVSIGRAGPGNRDDKGMNLGYVGSYIYWIVETLLVAGLAFALIKKEAQHPFCAQCESWKEERFLGGLNPPVEDAVRALHGGELEVIRSHGAAADGGEILVAASVCPKCGELSPVDVKFEQVRVNKKGEVSKKEVAHVTYPGEALAPLSSLFAVTAPPEEAAEASAT